MSRTDLRMNAGPYLATLMALKPVGKTTRTSSSPPPTSSKRVKKFPLFVLSLSPVKVRIESWKAAWSEASGVASVALVARMASPVVRGDSKKDSGVPPTKMRLAARATIGSALAAMILAASMRSWPLRKKVTSVASSTESGKRSCCSA